MQRIFQYFVLLSIITQIHSKFIRKYDECESFFDNRHCYYFPCLDAHYFCGRDSHLVRFSYDLCLLTTKKYVSQLTPNGINYFNLTNQCAMASLHEQLTEEKISAKFTCTDLQKKIFDIYARCFQSTQPTTQLSTVIDFCSIICENLQVMIDLFFHLNVKYFNLFELLIQTGKACGAEISEDTIGNLPSLLISICLDRKHAVIRRDITQIMFNQRYEPTEDEWV